ncbi:hypothetical protein [Chitinophaga barathri]|uniref:Uncharacterized protein n=1 Tax=Chitinophaga barathri TaxID=1647451 RepID=A0A3N4MCS7_9BACT|nr:hypothetical protein [Chitinophaga barathri]RPD39337.1 hypothetical protein EG028_19620 [Chitinophaga barathri]
MERILPTVTIKNEQYLVDLKSNQLVSANQADGVDNLSLDDFEIMVHENYQFYGYYHLLDKQMVFFDPKICELPEDVIAVVLPRASEIDPIAWAEMHGRTYDKENDGPVPDKIEAIIIPIEESDLAVLVEENRCIKHNRGLSDIENVNDVQKQDNADRKTELTAEEKEKIIGKVEKKLTRGKSKGQGM